MAARGVANGIPDPIVEADDEQLLESFSLIANVDKAWCRLTPTGAVATQAPPLKSTKPAPPKTALDVVVHMSQRNLPGNSLRKFLSSAHIPEPQGDLAQFHWAPFPVELSGVSAVSPSPSGARLLVVKNGTGEGDAAAVRLEVWGAGRLLSELYVPASVHGPVYADGLFESFSWTEDENAVVYVAETPAPAKRVFGRPPSAEAPVPAPVAPAVPAPARGRVQAPPPPLPAPEPVKATAEALGPGSWKGKGEWESDWGEQYTGKRRPALFVLDLVAKKVEAVEGIPEDLSVGQAAWAPPGVGEVVQTAIVFVAWSSFASNFPTPRQLGLKYCANRPCALYAAFAPGAPLPKGASSVVKLTPQLNSALSPHFSPDGSILVFLSASAAVDSGVHQATNSLHCMPWPADFPQPAAAPFVSKKGAATAAPDAGGVPSVELPVQTIIDVVPRAEEDGGFPGLYCTEIIRQPWLADGKTLLLTTAWRSTQAIIAVQIETGRVSRLTPDGPISWNLLDVCSNVVVAGASTPACPTKLMLGRMNAGWLKQEGWLWSEISAPHAEYAEDVESSLKATEFEVLSIPPSASKAAPALPEGAKQPFEAIFVRKAPEMPPAPPAGPSKVAPAPPPASPPAPLVVVPHGGPHAVMSTNFVMPYAYLCALGYSVLHVNYRGSLGFGEEALQSLPGHIGRQDVDDVLDAIDRVVELGYVDSSRIAVVGGSHGGFLAAHLIGQEPDKFQTAVLRNPVCNLATMVGTSDIPDWAFVETFGATGPAAYTEAPSAADLDAFLAISPISIAAKVKVPTLFLLGGQDRRVPPSNGLQYALALRAQGLEAKVIMFPEDAHPIEKPQSEFEHWLAIATWLKTYL